MRKINPNKIKKAEIVVGIPSYNEAKTIGMVTEKIDKGLRKYFKNKKAVIINADGNSPDQTAKAFLNTKTETPKICIFDPPKARGKGSGLRNIFLEIKRLGAKTGMLVDADMRSARPEWVKCLISPLLKGYDFVTPVYYRDKYDGSITNNLCYPLVYGLLGYNIRQPIAGEVGFSRKLVLYWLSQKWFADVEKYGIDIFMTINAIAGGFKLCRVDLGSRIHKSSVPNLDNMSVEVAGVLFKLLLQNKNLWQKKMIKVRELPFVCEVKEKRRYPVLKVNYQKFEEKALSEFPVYYPYLKKYFSPEIQAQLEKQFLEKKTINITEDLWVKILYEIFRIYSIKPSRKRLIKLLRALYFARLASFIKKTLDKSQNQAEKMVQRQARRFFRERNYLLSLMTK